MPNLKTSPRSLLKLLIMSALLSPCAIVNADPMSASQEQLLNDAVDVGYLIQATETCTAGNRDRGALINGLSKALRERSDDVRLQVSSVTTYIKAGANQANENFSHQPPSPLECIDMQVELRLLAKSGLRFER